MKNNLERFIKAQSGVFDQVIDEILAERKETHWMWFVFPQLRGLGRSEKSEFYGICSLEEARDYLAHPVLGSRIEQTTKLVLKARASPYEIFGAIDCQKFSSSMTLFGAASSPSSAFNRALREVSVIDERTIQILGEKNDRL